jgi:hypothetical protein
MKIFSDVFLKKERKRAEHVAQVVESLLKVLSSNLDTVKKKKKEKKEGRKEGGKKVGWGCSLVAEHLPST